MPGPVFCAGSTNGAARYHPRACPSPPQTPAAARPGRLRAGGARVLGLHLACFCYFVPPSVWWTDEPMTGVDYETHIAQVWRVLEGLDGWGRSPGSTTSACSPAPRTA
jgi:hypothetical protein